MNKTYLTKSNNYESLKKLLITAGYPEIKYKNIEFIKTLISKQNRLQLLTWAYFQINDENLSNDILETDLLDNKIKVIESFLTENGFCRPNQVNDFIVGTNIRLSIEFQILKRIFSYITCNKDCKSYEYEDFQPKTLSEIVKKKHTVLPTHIIPNQYSENDKQILYNDLLNEKCILEKEIRELESKPSLNEELIVTRNNNVDFEKIISDFEKNNEFDSRMINFKMVRKMEKLSEVSQSVNQLKQQSATIHNALIHINNLFKLVESAKFLRQLEQNAQFQNDSENNVQTENIQILEKTLSKLKEYTKQYK